MTISFQFLWYDLWVGVFVDRKKLALYLCPLPCCVFKVQLKREVVWRCKTALSYAFGMSL